MAKMVYQRDFAHRLMQLALAFFFLILGIQEVMSSQQSDLVNDINRGLNELMGRGMDPRLEMVVGILAVISGLLMLLGVFQLTNGRLVFLFTSIIMIYWSVRFVLIRFITDIVASQGALIFQPSLEQWLMNSSMDLIILCSLWMILRAYSRD
ncbi:MAG: hypothetical protein PF447_07065 [Spirochaetaceae bacterium]|nr:hypothetical protein [Spirochaetaceae bacterium]